MSLNPVKKGDPHIAAHNAERAAINNIKETLTGRLSETELNANFVRYIDQNGDPLPTGSLTTIVINTDTGDIEDIIYDETGAL